VGLALSLIQKLRQAHPGLRNSIGPVSCEEAVKDVGSYCMQSPNNVKEHILVAIRVCIQNNRYGFVLLDPGYHVARPVVVMNDCAYPHTSWFVQSKNSKSIKEYQYQVITDEFIAWNVKETRSGKASEEWSNLIYAKRAFTNCISIPEKRSLIYSFKSLVIRDRKGPTAGMYCWIESKCVTIFYDEHGERKQIKIPLERIGSQSTEAHLRNLAFCMKDHPDVDIQTKQLHQMLMRFKVALNDSDFMPHLLDLDKWIEEE